jgi:hypothetical protein
MRVRFGLCVDVSCCDLFLFLFPEMILVLAAISPKEVEKEAKETENSFRFLTLILILSKAMVEKGPNDILFGNRSPTLIPTPAQSKKVEMGEAVSCASRETSFFQEL